MATKKNTSKLKTLHTSRLKTLLQKKTSDNCQRSSNMSIFGNVPLKIAMIGWTPKWRKSGIQGKIIIIPKTNDRRDWFGYFGVTNSAGACDTYWQEMTDKERLLQLYIEFWHIISRDGILPKDVHAAFTVIPEYRDSLSECDGFFLD